MQISTFLLISLLLASPLLAHCPKTHEQLKHAEEIFGLKSRAQLVEFSHTYEDLVSLAELVVEEDYGKKSEAKEGLAVFDFVIHKLRGSETAEQSNAFMKKFSESKPRLVMTLMRILQALKPFEGKDLA